MATALSSSVVTRNTANGLDLAAAGTAADVAGNTFTNDGTTLLRFKNTNAATRTATVTFASQAIDGSTLTNPTGKSYTIPLTTGDRLCGPFPVVTYGTNPLITYDAVSNLSVTVIQPAI